MTFRIIGLSPETFRPLFGLSDADLARAGAKRFIADSSPGFPDRIEMRDAAVGETVILVNYQHQPAGTPYRASHGIFVREGAEDRYDRIDEIPDVLACRLLSLRAYDLSHMMIDADVTEGRDLAGLIERFFSNPAVSYLHAHNARQGCFAGLIERA